MLSLRRSAADPTFVRRFCCHQLVVLPMVWLLSVFLQYQLIPRPTLGPASRPAGVQHAGMGHADMGHADMGHSGIGQVGFSSGDAITVTLIDHSGAVAVTPQGWRRTADGWEHTTDWRAEGTLGPSPQQTMRAHLTAQAGRKPTIAGQAVEMLRSTSPVVIALWQVILISGIWAICPSRKKRTAR